MSAILSRPLLHTLLMCTCFCIPRLGPLRMTSIIALQIQDKTGTELENIPVLRYYVSCYRPRTGPIDYCAAGWLSLDT
ncbi:hypothetical protein B0H14DRAFT_2713529 [Mycena olivaceomarginata]|nr:hypothetical protein B0H14DRAFT_2713529 [Mycena olivaceomarginata]